ncbi:unnamed protein product [Leptosia nina]|uniref:Uncharacterized protein n=1 Tax=Leptosia nina TaxID=320188 RepID=A0AAV1K5X7_9NEOP
MDLIQVWGDIALMKSTAFVLCINMVRTIKITNLLRRKQRIGKLVRSNNKVLQQATGVEERKLLQKLYLKSNSLKVEGGERIPELGSFRLYHWFSELWHQSIV